MYMYTLTPFCPSADNNAIGATLWRTESHSKNRETLLEEMKSVLQTPLPPTVFSLTEDSDNEKKKKAATRDKKDHFYHAILSLLHSPSLKHLFL